MPESKQMEIVIYEGYGGFKLNEAEYKRYSELSGTPILFSVPKECEFWTIPLEEILEFLGWDDYIPMYKWDTRKTERTLNDMIRFKAENTLYIGVQWNRSDPYLVQLVDELNPDETKLRIEEIPEGYGYSISIRDGYETVNYYPLIEYV